MASAETASLTYQNPKSKDKMLALRWIRRPSSGHETIDADASNWGWGRAVRVGWVAVKSAVSIPVLITFLGVVIGP